MSGQIRQTCAAFNVQEVFEKGEKDDLEDVPDLLEGIDNSAKSANEGMDQTENAFQQTCELIEEILESLVAKKSNVQDKLRKLQMKVDRVKNDIRNKKCIYEKNKEKLQFYQEELAKILKKQKESEENKKFWEDVKVVGDVGIPIATGLVSLYLAGGSSDKIAYSVGVSSGAWNAFSRYCGANSKDFSQEINEAKRRREQFEKLVQRNSEDLWKTRYVIFSLCPQSIFRFPLCISGRF